MAACHSQKEPCFPSLVSLAVAEISYYELQGRYSGWLVGCFSVADMMGSP